MIAILIIVIILLTVTLVYTFDKIGKQEEHLEGYRLMVLEWHSYLAVKQHGEDFELWNEELRE
jgi:hypothetical protein